MNLFIVLFKIANTKLKEIMKIPLIMLFVIADFLNKLNHTVAIRKKII